MNVYGLIAVKTMIVVLTIHLISFYFRLGYVLIFVWLAGALVAMIATLPERRRSSKPILGIAVTIVAYAVFLPILFVLMFDHERLETFRVRPIVVEPYRGGPTELRLEFVDHPGHALVSTVIPDMHPNPDILPLELGVTRDLGCIRGFYPVSLGGHELRADRFSLQTRGDVPSLWPNPFWCP